MFILLKSYAMKSTSSIAAKEMKQYSYSLWLTNRKPFKYVRNNKSLFYVLNQKVYNNGINKIF